MPKPNTMDDWIDELLEQFAIECISGEYLPATYAEKAKALITAKLEEVDRAARLDERKTIKYELIQQHKAASKNLQYQIERTGNENLIREWTGTVQGIKFCIDAIARLAELRKDENAAKS